MFKIFPRGKPPDPLIINCHISHASVQNFPSYTIDLGPGITKGLAMSLILAPPLPPPGVSSRSTYIWAVIFRINSASSVITIAILRYIVWYKSGVKTLFCVAHKRSRNKCSFFFYNNFIRTSQYITISDVSIWFDFVLIHRYRVRYTIYRYIVASLIAAVTK